MARRSRSRRSCGWPSSGGEGHAGGTFESPGGGQPCEGRGPNRRRFGIDHLRAPRHAVAPRRQPRGLALDALQQRGAVPRVGRRLDGRRRRRGLAQEALERGDDGSGLLGRGGRGDDLELGTAVGHDGREGYFAARGYPVFGQYFARSEIFEMPSALAVSRFMTRLLRSSPGAIARCVAPMRASARWSAALTSPLAILLPCRYA